MTGNEITRGKRIGLSGTGRRFIVLRAPFDADGKIGMVVEVREMIGYNAKGLEVPIESPTAMDFDFAIAEFRRVEDFYHG